MKKSKISLMLVLMLVLVTVSNSVFAATASIVDTTKKGSLTITALEQLNGASDTTPLAGVEYSLYKVDVVAGTTVTTVAQAETAIATMTATEVVTTDDAGVAAFTNLELGRYYAKVTGYPTGTSSVPESFIVDVPMTNTAGDGWIYDITVSPKVKTASGNAVLTKLDGEQEPMAGVKFKVQISTEENVWTDYTPEGATEVLTLTTDANGEVKLENYPITVNEKAAKFRFVETEVAEGYIIDNSQLDYVYATADGKTVVVHANGDAEEAAETGMLQMINEKPAAVKTVKTDDGSYADVASVNATDVVSFNVTVDVPTVIANMSTYTLTDTLPAGLTNRTNLVVKGLLRQGGAEENVATDAYTKTDANGVLTLTFNPDKIATYTTIVVTYDVSVDTDVVVGSVGNTNTATLEYTTEVDVDGTEKSKDTTEDTAKVVTGGVKIHKVDPQGAALANAKFKIATSQANAIAGTFVKDATGADIEVATAADGYAVINGLAYNDDETARDYWLVETQAPTYTETVDGVETTKAYTLLSAPVKVSVSGTSHTVDVEVVNKKPYNLPLTGGMGTIIFTLVGISLVVIAKSIKKEKVQQ